MIAINLVSSALSLRIVSRLSTISLMYSVKRMVPQAQTECFATRSEKQIFVIESLVSFPEYISEP